MTSSIFSTAGATQGILGQAAAVSGFTGQFTLFASQAANKRSIGKASQDYSSNKSPYYFGEGGLFAAPAVVRERNIDQYQVTEHPTINGTFSTDHAFALPRRVDIEVLYSVSTGGTNGLKAIAAAADITSVLGIKVPEAPLSIRDYYNAFRNLQHKMIPFDITTGKQKYTNMIIESLEENTTEATENLLKLYIKCKEVKISYTQYVQSSISADVLTAGSTQQSVTSPTSTSATNISTTNSYGAPSIINPPKIPGVPVQ